MSRSGERFSNRAEAGRLLGEALWSLKGSKAVVLGIPRGGVVVAVNLAQGIDGELDVILAHKIGAPGHPELAIGSVAENGSTFVDSDFVQQYGIPDSYIQQERVNQQVEMERRSALIRKVRPKVSLENRVVIIADDGVATGATTLAAVWAVKAESPQRVIGAFPVGSEGTISMLSQAMDELVCLRTPPNFMAVGQFYRAFDQVSDSEVLEVLSDSLSRARAV